MTRQKIIPVKMVVGNKKLNKVPITRQLKLTELKINNKEVDKKMEKIEMYQEQEYFCSKCERIHKKMRKHVISKIYKEHYEFKEKLTKNQLFKKDFVKKWKKEGKKQEKKEIISPKLLINENEQEITDLKIEIFDYHCCNENHKGTITQLKTEYENVLCPICHKIMTFGNYTSRLNEGFIFITPSGNHTYIEHVFDTKLYYYFHLFEIDVWIYDGKTRDFLMYLETMNIRVIDHSIVKIDEKDGSVRCAIKFCSRDYKIDDKLDFLTNWYQIKNFYEPRNEIIEVY